MTKRKKPRLTVIDLGDGFSAVVDSRIVRPPGREESAKEYAARAARNVAARRRKEEASRYRARRRKKYGFTYP